MYFSFLWIKILVRSLIPTHNPISFAHTGELGILFDIPRTASVRALSNCYCMRLNRTDLETALQPFPLISERFRAVVAERMVEVEKKRSDRGGKGTLKRLDFVPNVGRVVEVAKEEEDAP